ncbi:hypothetical protein [Legionella pneumophila]|uniref:hypothetical protein n=1 Tax=Legionella pneumophila TaxID=446 RepID=UPI00197D0229|nr:hypothetical protein [Legionella pneumophila]MBN5930128.1 hypothetical protein [Legionella pneumophila]
MQIKKLGKQIIKEFWFPFLISALWVYININKERSISDIITLFASAFFFTCWLSGQYFRISKQAKVEGNLSRIQARMEEVLVDLELKTKDIIAHLTGGESFCYFLPLHAEKGTNIVNTMVQHEGRHSLFNVQARVLDMQAFEKIKPPITLEKMNQCHNILSYDTLTTGHCLLRDKFALGEGEQRDFNIFWLTINGSFEQNLQFKKINNIWYYSTRVIRKGEVLVEKVQEGFPT